MNWLAVLSTCGTSLTQPWGSMFNFLASYFASCGGGHAVVLVAVTLGLGSAVANSDDTVAEIERSQPRRSRLRRDVLLRVTLPRKHRAAVCQRRAVPARLHAAPDGNGYLALVTGSPLGRNTITCPRGGAWLHLDVTNIRSAPSSFRPHLQPWTCTTQNNGLGPRWTRTAMRRRAMRSSTRTTRSVGFVAYDRPIAGGRPDRNCHDGPGSTRSVHRAAGDRTLNRTFNGSPCSSIRLSPGRLGAAAAWNGKVLYLFGAGAGTQYAQGNMPPPSTTTACRADSRPRLPS